MKKSLFIHIGWHKTATSLIQQYLARHRAELAEMDVCYPTIDDRPDSGQIKHGYFYLSMLNKLQVDHLQKNLEICEFDELFSLSVNQITASGCRYAIISEEALSSPVPGLAALLGRYRDYFDDVRIVAWLRRQDYFFESLYAQFVKQKPRRTTLDFKEYLANSDLKERADYGRILGWWAEVFGSENMIVVPFESEFYRPDPVTAFCASAGLPALTRRFPLKKTTLHVSPPREVTEYFRYLNIYDTDFFVPVLTEYLLESGAEITDTKVLCRDEREKILTEYAASNREVARRYLNRDDGILFHEPVRDFSNCSTTWNGLSPLEILGYALPVSGRMSHEIAGLRHENARLKQEILELTHGNMRIANWKKKVSKFFR